jgi:subtilisin-like proprotein convertase family protein
VPTNNFTAQWSGIISPQVQGDHVFYVSVEAGARFSLTVNGTTIEQLTNSLPYAVELVGTNWLGTNIAYDIKLIYVHFTNAAQVTLSWLEPGMTKEVIPSERFQNTSQGPTGISVDAAGKIWAGCLDRSTAVRIDPDAGPLVVKDDQTNHVGLVDMVVNLGDRSASDPHQPPYDAAAKPYNYSDMTGFNNRVVNPGLKPLKGYWTVINDCGLAGEVWKSVSWNAALTNGCSVEVYVRASDDRLALADEAFLQVTKNALITPQVKGRFIEVRLAMVRDDASKQPVLYDLTLHGISSGFNQNAFLDDAPAYETQDATFTPAFTAPGPLMYQWYVQYPWMNGWDWTLVAGATNSSFVMTNVDSWVDGTFASVYVTDTTGESLWLGRSELERAELVVYPMFVTIPASGSSGPASRYPMTINVFDQPTNLASVIVTNWDLSHTHSADLDILLVSPSGTNIMLMSHVGGTNGVSHANLVFKQWQQLPPQAGPIPSGVATIYSPSNYALTNSLPNAPPGPYSTSLDDLVGSNPNGIWKLYIYDDRQGGVGSLSGSWQLGFTF